MTSSYTPPTQLERDLSTVYAIVLSKCDSRDETREVIADMLASHRARTLATECPPLVLQPAAPQPDAPIDIVALPDYWDERRRKQGKPDLSRCAAELRAALIIALSRAVPAPSHVASELREKYAAEEYAAESAKTEWLKNKDPYED